MNFAQRNETDRETDADDGNDSAKSDDSVNQNDGEEDDADFSDDATDVDSIKPKSDEAKYSPEIFF